MALSIFSSQFKARRLLISGVIALHAAVIGAAVGEFITTVSLLSPSRAALAQNASIDQAEAAVVYIETEYGRGSGVIVDSEGLILTNAHVVEGARQVEVIIQGRTVPAEVVAMGSANCLDLALLQVSNQPSLPVISFGDIASIHKTQKVYAIGYPGVLSPISATVTQGIVSNLHPDSGEIQFDGPINGGNSGGAVVNERGELIGIARRKITGSPDIGVEGMSFAVAIDKIVAFVDAYRQQASPLIGPVLMPGSNPDSGQLVQALALDGQLKNGVLQSGDSTFCGDTSLADVYTFEAEAGQGVMVEMSSQDMGIYLMLVSPSGEQLASTGREGHNQVAMILEKLPETGTYTVVANAYNPDRSGRYQIRATEPVLVERGALDVSTPPCFEEGQRCQDYRFQGQANQTVTVVLQQAEFDPYLALVNASGEVIARGQTDRDAVLNFTLPEDGWYTLVVSSVDIDGKGQFMVSVHDTRTLTSSQDVSQR